MLYIGYNYKIKYSKNAYNYLLNIFKNILFNKWNSLQIYFGDKRKTTLNYKYKLTNDEYSNLNKFIKNNNIKLLIHSILTINLCNPPNSMRFKWGLDNIIFDIIASIKLGAVGVVIHLGRIKTSKINISENEAIKNYINSLIYIINEVNKLTKKKFNIIIETNNNQINTIGGTIHKLAKIYNKIPDKYKKYIYFCIDTQHIFSAGYNIRNINIAKKYFNDFNKLIGKIKLIHLNDSDVQLNTRINRHQELQKGFLFNYTKKGNPNSLQYLLSYFVKKKYIIIMETNCNHINEKKIINKYLGSSKNFHDIIINIFTELKNFHELLGKHGNTHSKYRASSYAKAIKSINNKQITSINDVKYLNGFGKSFINKVDEIIKTGTLSLYENIKQNKTYNAIKLFTKIYGIGSEKAYKLVNNNIYTINELKIKLINNPDLLNEHQKIGLKYYNELNERIPRDEIKYITNKFKKKFKNLFNAGSYRLGKETSGDIDIIICNININNIIDYLNKNNMLIHIFSKSNNKIISVIKYKYKNKIKIHQLDLAVIDKKILPFYLLYFGSSKEFSKKIRAIAAKKGYKLTNSGIFNRKTNKIINFTPINEKNIFQFLNIKYVNPSNR